MGRYPGSPLESPRFDRRAQALRSSHDNLVGGETELAMKTGSKPQK
jgi:hypothetical protein